MLQNTVSGVCELHNVKTQSAHDVAHGGKPLTYQSYKTLLLSAASIYDANQGLSYPRPTRTIQEADIGFDNSDDSDTEDVFFDIDTDLSSLEINQTKQVKKFVPNKRPTSFTPRMSSDKWHSLTPSEQKLWDQLSASAKATILGIGQPPPPRTPRTLDLHDISAADYLHIVNAHSQHSSVTSHDNLPTVDVDHTPEPSPKPDPESPSSNDDLLAYATKQTASLEIFVVFLVIRNLWQLPLPTLL